jgi:hypothetical protein
MAPRKPNQPASWEIDADKQKPEGETRVRRSYAVKELITCEFFRVWMGGTRLWVMRMDLRLRLGVVEGGSSRPIRADHRRGSGKEPIERTTTVTLLSTSLIIAAILTLGAFLL